MNHFSFALLRCPAQSLNRTGTVQPMESELFLEGLYLSSKELYNQFISSENIEKKKADKLSSSIFKYWIRNCTRCTPFGTFAGAMLINFQDAPTNVELNRSEAHIRKTRLDMGVLASIVYRLLENEEIFNKVKLFPNDSLYFAEDELRFVEYTLADNKRTYKLSSVPQTDYLTSLLAFCKSGATFSEIASFLTSYADVDQEEAIDYVNSLCNSQLIVSNLEPNLTGEDPLNHLLKQLDSISVSSSVIDQLKKIKTILDNPKSSVNYLKILEKELSTILPPTLNSLQVDLFLTSTSSNIDKRLMNNLVSQMDRLSVLNSYVDNHDLKTFKDKFKNKYGDKSVPLTIAMDSEIGIGYSYLSDIIYEDMGLLEDVFFRGKGKNEKKNGDFDYLQKFSLIKYDEYLRSNLSQINITDKELDDLRHHTEKHKIANSLYTMGSLISQDGKFDEQNFVFDLKFISGPNAGSLLSRFTYADSELLDLVKNSLRAEEAEHPDSIYAEIIHLPQSRVGNILQRPILRDYEILYLGQSGIEPDKRIFVDDLMVSIENDEIVLRSKTLQKRILPRLTNAHNFVIKNLPLYKFLCDLQTQGNSYIKLWDWGNLDMLNHLPRVVYKNIIIKKAKWQIFENEISYESNKNISFEQHLLELFSAKGIPYQITISESGEDLYIDLNTLEGQNLFANLLKKYKRLVVNEFLFNNENCFVKDVDGNPYTNEIIIPLFNEVSIKSDKKAPTQVFQPESKFFLGSEWLYFKIYAGKSILTDLLAQTLPKLLDENIDEKFFEKFFYLHYKDEEGEHIRLRFYNNDISRQARLQEKFLLCLKPYTDSNKIISIKMDTYERENNRYFGNLIEYAESIFFNDSVFAVNFLRFQSTVKYDITYYSLIIHSIDCFLEDFGIDYIQKTHLIGVMQKSFFKEFNGDKFLQKQLNDKYRQYRKEIDLIFQGNPKTDLENKYFALVKQRSSMNRINITKMISNLNGNESEVLMSVIPSYIHMSINRLFSSNQRKHELIIYHLLERYLYQVSQIRKSINSEQ